MKIRDITVHPVQAPGRTLVIVLVETDEGLTGGGTTFEGAYQTTTTPMIPADGEPHAWTLEFDPGGGGGDGLMTFTMDGQVYTAAMEEGHRAEGAVFDRFGIVNVQNSGNDLALWLDDIEIDDHREDFSTDPKWDALGHRVTFNDFAIRPWHSFGFRPTSLAGGTPGEIGGLVWRIEATRPQEALAYGTPVGELSLRQELMASGKICLKAAGADSGILFGWYNSLTSSLDGAAWQWIPGGDVMTGGPEGSWDAGCVFGGCGLTEIPGDRVVLPYGGYRYPHKYPRWGHMGQVGLACWKKERIAALVADEEAEFWTQSIIVPGETLYLNFETKQAGYIKVEVDGREGRKLDDCDVLIGDRIKSPVTWRGETSLKVKNGGAATLRFRMRAAKLYSFEIR